MSEHEGIWTEYRPTYADHWSACKRMGDLVRCRDCIFAQGTQSKRAKTVACTHFITLDCFENPVPSDVEPDGFCAWGKRRDA